MYRIYIAFKWSDAKKIMIHCTNIPKIRCQKPVLMYWCRWHKTRSWFLCQRVAVGRSPSVLGLKVTSSPLFWYQNCRCTISIRRDTNKKRVQKFWGVKFVTPFRKLWWRHHFRNGGIRKFTFQAFRQYRHVIVPTLSFNAKKIQDGERAVCCFLIVFVVKTIKGKSWHFWSNRVRGSNNYTNIYFRKAWNNQTKEVLTNQWNQIHH